MFWSNGEQLEKIAISKAFQQGLSFVETIRINQGRLCYLKKHLNRLYSAFEDFNLTPAWDLERLEVALLSFLSQSAVLNGRGRLQSYDHERLQYVVFTVDDFVYDYEQTLVQGLSLGLATSVRPSTDKRYGYKTNQYFSALLEQQNHPECHELLYLNEKGHLTEGTKSNVFFVKGSHLFTPDLSCNILKGIMRQEVTEILRTEGFEFHSGCYTIEDIRGAESIFITNALLPVAYIRTFLDRSYAPLNLRLMNAFKYL